MRRKLILLAALALLAVGGAATYAWASRSSDPAQTINACVGADGRLRVVAVAGDCKKGETPVDWNTVGPTGPTGPTGPAGSVAADLDAVVATVLVHGQTTGDFAQTPIGVTKLSHSIVSPRDPATGLPTGKRMHKPLSITMAWGPSTPHFISSLVTNENLTSVLIGLLHDGQQVATIALTNASVAGFDEHGSNVTFSFTYEKIEWTWVGGDTAMDDWEAPVT